MSTKYRRRITYGLALLVGTALFFLGFAALFTGMWPLGILFVLGYGMAGIVGVRFGGVPPRSLAIALALSVVPWVLWLFPATIDEAGVLRALFWPALVLVVFGLSWLSGRTALAAPAGPRSAERSG